MKMKKKTLLIILIIILILIIGYLFFVVSEISGYVVKAINYLSGV